MDLTNISNDDNNISNTDINYNSIENNTVTKTNNEKNTFMNSNENLKVDENDVLEKEKARLYVKVQNIIKNAKIEKYMDDKEKIVEEGVSLLGGITGRNSLQIERLKNVKLKIELLQSKKLGKKVEYKPEELMADLYACAISELGGSFNLDMQQIYREIRDKYLNGINKDETENYIYELACKKIDNGQSYLPIIHEEKTKGIFGDIRVQTRFLKLENKKLENEIIIQRGKSQFETFKKEQEKGSVIVPVDWKNRKNA